MAVWRLSIRGSLALVAVGAMLVLPHGPVQAQATAPEPQIAAPAGHARSGQPPIGGSAAEETPPASRPIRPPVDPVAAAAYHVLDKHCARCHQGGRLMRAAPSAGFGNILRLDEVAGLAHLVLPGNPDGSRLYTMMLRRLMPIDVYSEGAQEPPPTADDVAAVRTWISGLPRRPTCQDRRPVTTADQTSALTQIVEAKAEDPSKLRFVSIAHLHNGCVRFGALAAYRQAIVRLFNSLSWKPAPVPVTAVDSARTLFKINLDDLGWLSEHWERIMQAGIDPLGLAAPLAAEVTRPFGTAVPIARADWLAETVLAAPLYFDVLGLPGTGPEILKILRVDATRQAATAGGLRAVARPSGFSTQPALMERIGTPTGPLWQAYHSFARETGSDLTERAARPVGEAVPHHASRGMFTLPNGLPGFYIVGQRGDRLDALPPDIALPSVSTHGEVRGGLDCFACHGQGPAQRDLSGLPQPVTEAIAGDRKAVVAALRKIGVDPDLKLDGVEPVVALANAYARPVDASRVAAELGVPLDALVRLADQGDGLMPILARRLLQGLVSREEVELRARDLVAALGREAPEANGESGRIASRQAGEADFRPIDPGPGLILYSDKVRYRKGDLLNLSVRVSADCHLTLVSIDQRGRGTVLFPSDFESSTLLRAGQELKLPGSGAPYSFRLNEAGQETVVAICNEAAGTATDDIRHDFERQRFTDLGIYATFLAQHAFPSAGKPDAAPRPEPRRLPRHRRGRSEPVEPQAPPERVSRAAIRILVE